MSKPPYDCPVCEDEGYWWVNDGHSGVEKRWCREVKCKARLNQWGPKKS